MKITVKDNLVGGVKLGSKIVIYVEHKDSRIEFSGNSFSSLSTDDFTTVNKFIESLDPAIQDNIFSAYLDAKNVLSDIWNLENLVNNLQNIAVKLYFNLNFNATRNWVSFNTVLLELINFESEYKKEMDDTGSRGQTYLKNDYLDLITMIILLRLFTPIWNEFIDKTKKDYGNNFKEYYAFRLIRDTFLYECPAMIKLTEYIDYPIKSNFNDTEIIVAGISSDEITTWMLGLVVIRRLLIGPIETGDPDANFITHIYKYVFRKSQASGGTGSKSIKEKRIRKNDDDDEKESSLDRYKIKYNVSGGEVAEIEFALEHYEQILATLVPEYDSVILADNIQTATVRLVNAPIQPCQIKLLSWVTNELVSARGLLYINKELLLKLIGVAQTVYWHLGYPILSFMVGGYVNKDGENFVIVGSDSKFRIDKELIKELETYFPYAKKIGKKNIQVRPTPIIETINTISSEFTNFGWYITSKDRYIKEIYGPDGTNTLAIPGDIKIELSRALLSIIKIQYEKMDI